MKTTTKIQEEKKDTRKAIYAALIFLKLLILFFLLVSMDEPDPPLKEEIIEVEIDFGGEAGGSSPSSESSSESTNSVTESAQEVDQQEESPVVVPSGSGSSPKATNTQPVEETPQPDNSLGFPSGNGGDTNGNNNGPGFGDRDGHDGNGPSGPGEGEGTVNLKRKIVDKGGITAQSQEEGKVAIDIWVNDKGEVVKTKLNASKSNSPSQYLIGLAKKWAKTMQYEKSLGSPTQYVGYQVFSFTKH